MGEQALGITILVSFNMPKSDFDRVAKLYGVTDDSIHVIIVVGGIVRPGHSCIKHQVDVRNDTLVVAETLESCACVLGATVV